MFFASYVPFVSEEVGKVECEPVALLRVERAGIAIDRKLNSRLDSDGAVDSQQAWPEKHLFRFTTRYCEVLSLKRAGSFAGKLSKNAPIPTGIICPPGKRAIAINGGVRKQVGAAVAFRFRVTLISGAYPDVLTPDASQ